MAKTVVDDNPIQVRLLRLRPKFERRRAQTGFGPNAMIRLAVEEMLEKYQTPEEIIAAMVRSRTSAAAGGRGL